MLCLIVGGGGFLGSHLAFGLLAQGHTVRILDRPNLHRFEGVQSPTCVEWHEGDFANHDDLLAAISGCDVLFHLAWTTLPKSSNGNPVYDVETNVVGTLRLLELASQQHVKKVIFVSSGGTVYGIPKSIPIPESHPTDPLCAYGISKLTAEKYVHLYHAMSGLDYCIVRLANPFGERQKPTGSQGVVSVFLDKALRNEPIEIWGDGSVVRDYIYVGDVVDAFMKVAVYTGEHRVFNVGSGEGKSLRDVIAAIEAMLGRKISCAFFPGRRFDVPINVLDISRIRTALGWEPKTSFNSGLFRMVTWLSLNRGVVGKAIA